MLHFRVAKNGYKGYLTVSARVWYQSLPPKWMMPMFAWSSPEIDAFKAMFDAADRSPVLVAEQVLDSVYVSPTATRNLGNEDWVKISPTLSADGHVTVGISPQIRLLRVQAWDASGRLVLSQTSPDLWLPRRAGVYVVVVETSAGRAVRKVVVEF